MLLKMVGRCPFDSSHQDFAVMLYEDGWPATKCFHDSCQEYGWKDFQKLWVEDYGLWRLPGKGSARLFSVEDVDAVPGTEGEIPLYEFTDLGRMERLEWRYGATTRYSPKSGWYRYSGTYWRGDALPAVTEACIATVQSIPEEFERWMVKGDYLAGYTDADAARRALNKFRSASGSKTAISAMEALAQVRLHTEEDAFDRHDFLFNCTNGTVDLMTGELREHRTADLITKMSGVEFDSTATCPRWTQFMSEITCGDEALAGYLQRAVGYSLTGDTREHCAFILHGGGSNGKSTFLNTVSHVLGTYSQAAEMKTFMVQHHEGIGNDVAALKGARLITASEGEEGQRLAEAKLKRLTGQDVRARHLYQEGFDFVPKFKLWFSTNSKPSIYGTDDGIWRRLRTIPFFAKFEDAAKDSGLGDKLKAEASGIFNWALAGFKEYLKGGLREPEAVTGATGEYRDNEDVVGRFLQEMVEREQGAMVGAEKLYEKFREWLEANGEPWKPSMKKLAEQMRLKGYESKRLKVEGRKQTVYIDLRFQGSLHTLLGFDTEEV